MSKEKDIDNMKDEELRGYIREDLAHKQKIREQQKQLQPLWCCFGLISIVISIISIIWIMQPIDYGW